MAALAKAPLAKGAFVGQKVQQRSRAAAVAPVRASLNVRAEAEVRSRHLSYNTPTSSSSFVVIVHDAATLVTLRKECGKVRQRDSPVL
jgi:hypothetical protein